MARDGFWVLPFFEEGWVEGKEQSLSVQMATWLKVEILALQLTFFH